MYNSIRFKKQKRRDAHVVFAFPPCDKFYLYYNIRKCQRSANDAEKDQGFGF